MNENRHYWAWGYVDEKLDTAIEILARSFAPNWERMTNALLQVTLLLPAHFPDQELYRRLDKLLAKATAYGPLKIGSEIYRGAIENTLRRRKRSTLEKYAAELIEIRRQVALRRGHYTEI